MAEHVHCLVEIPKGSRNKYEWDEELQAIKLDRFLFTLGRLSRPTTASSRETLGEDGDPLDAMVVRHRADVPRLRHPGEGDRAVPDARRQGRRRQGRLRAARATRTGTRIETLEDLPQPLRDEISHFFSIYKQPEGKHVEVDGWFPREEALRGDRGGAPAARRGARRRDRGLPHAGRALRRTCRAPTSSRSYPEGRRLRLPTSTKATARPSWFMHGEPTWSYLWRKVIPPRARRRASAASRPTCRASGARTSRPTSAGTPTTATPRRMAALLEELDVRDATFVVHDWGGPIGLRLAVEHPERARGSSSSTPACSPATSR